MSGKAKRGRPKKVNEEESDEMPEITSISYLWNKVNQLEKDMTEMKLNSMITRRILDRLTSWSYSNIKAQYSRRQSMPIIITDLDDKEIYDRIEKLYIESLDELTKAVLKKIGNK